MSHALGEVYSLSSGNGSSEDSGALEFVGYFEYNGTMDYACPKIWPDMESCHRHWRTLVNSEAECSCGGLPETVVLYSSYGNGYYWDAKACLVCGVITGKYSPYHDIEDPNWGGPLRGHPLSSSNERNKHARPEGGR